MPTNFPELTNRIMSELTNRQHTLRKYEERLEKAREQQRSTSDDPYDRLDLYLDGIVQFLAELPKARSEYLGRKSEFARESEALRVLEPPKRKEVGQYLNWFKQQVERDLDQLRKTAEDLKLQFELLSERIDPTLPPRPSPSGLIHPISRTIEEITAIFGAMDFMVGEGLD